MASLRLPAHKHNSRRSCRTLVSLPATLHASGARHNVHLLNISTEGAMLKIDAPTGVGASVVLSSGAVNRVAVVMWRDGRLLGVRFTDALGETDVDRQAHRSSAVEALQRRVQVEAERAK